MSPESLLLNALQCHLVFAGSLWLIEAGGELERSWGPVQGRWGAVENGAPACLMPGVFRGRCSCFGHSVHWQQEKKSLKTLCTQKFWMHFTPSQRTSGAVLIPSIILGFAAKYKSGLTFKILMFFLLDCPRNLCSGKFPAVLWAWASGRERWGEWRWHVKMQWPRRTQYLIDGKADTRRLMSLPKYRKHLVSHSETTF